MTRLTSLTLSVLTASLIIVPPPIDARPVAAACITSTIDDYVEASTILPIGQQVQLEHPAVVSYIYTVTSGGTSEQRQLTLLFGPYPDGGGSATGTLNMVGVGQLDMTQGYAYVIDEPVAAGGATSKIGGGTRPTIQTPRTITTSDSTRYIVHITTDVDRVYIVEGNSKVTKRRATSNQVVSPCPAAGKYIEVDNAGAHHVKDTPADSAFIQHVKEVAAQFQIESP